MLGIILQLQNKPLQAQAVYEKLLASGQQAPLAANNLAMLMIEGGGNLDVALNHAQAAKKALPDDPDINDTLGLVYLKKGLGALAVSVLEQSTQAKPDNPVYWLHLGQAYAVSGDKTKARDALGRALKVDPAFEGAGEARKALASLDGAVATF
jgi:tetratricopeptide (TPR) repeat protein